jgi:hypothetical protein
VPPDQHAGQCRHGQGNRDEGQDQGLPLTSWCLLIGSVATRPSEPSSEWPAMDDAPYPMVSSRTIKGKKLAYRLPLTHPAGEVSDPVTPSSAATVGLSAVSDPREESDLTAGYIATRRKAYPATPTANQRMERRRIRRSRRATSLRMGFLREVDGAVVAEEELVKVGRSGPNVDRVQRRDCTELPTELARAGHLHAPARILAAMERHTSGRGSESESAVRPTDVANRRIVAVQPEQTTAATATARDLRRKLTSLTAALETLPHGRKNLVVVGSESSAQAAARRVRPAGPAITPVHRDRLAPTHKGKAVPSTGRRL